jgi:hypothetical protein
VLLETGGGRERYATELARWDQLGLAPASGGLDALLLAGVRAAVLAPEDEARRWFSWRHAAADVDCLVEAGRLGRAGGLLYAI